MCKFISYFSASNFARYTAIKQQHKQRGVTPRRSNVDPFEFEEEDGEDLSIDSVHLNGADGAFSIDLGQSGNADSEEGSEDSEDEDEAGSDEESDEEDCDSLGDDTPLATLMNMWERRVQVYFLNN